MSLLQSQSQSQSQEVSCLVGPCLTFIQMTFDYLLGWRFHNLSQRVWRGFFAQLMMFFFDVLLSAAQPTARVGG